MSKWWQLSSWWDPRSVTNPRSYVLYIYFSPKGRINVRTWFWFWLYITLIWFYYFWKWYTVSSSSYYDDFMESCTGTPDYWQNNWADNRTVINCDADYIEHTTPILLQFLFVWTLLLYPFWVVSLKRYHDIGYNSNRLWVCIICCVLWGLGILIYLYDMTRTLGLRGGPSYDREMSLSASSFDRAPIANFGEIWDFESKEMRTASKWEAENGFVQAISIYNNLKRKGDVVRVQKNHIKAVKDIFVLRLSELKRKKVDCTGLEIMTEELNEELSSYFNIKND